MSGAEKHSPRVFTIPAGVAFLPTLADALLERRLAPFGDDPLALASVTVLLPTRRAVRAFRDVLIARLGPGAAILPVIRPIGDVDEEESLLDPAVEAPEDQIILPQAISALSRRLVLTRLSLAWSEALRAHPLGLAEGAQPLVAGTAADAARLAGDLARLLDDIEIAGVPWERLDNLAPEDHAAYYGLTLEFLRIIREAWPAYLAERNLVDPAARRNTLIAHATARLDAARGPVIAAGSTGSVPTTAALLARIARMENGAVVLPGLDQALDEAGWTSVAGEEPVHQTHPQYGLSHLIGRIGIMREDVTVLGSADETAMARARLVSEAMRPADTLEAWAAFPRNPAALEGAALLLARNEQEEALAIALALREAVEQQRSAALVTPDRTIARRVAAELARWHLAVDDSAGRPLEHEPHGVFARLVVEAAATGDPIHLLALAKHPLAAFGMAPAECRAAARALELGVFRGHRMAGGLAELPAEVERAAALLAGDGAHHAHPARTALGEEGWAFARRLAAALADALLPLQAFLSTGEKVSVADITACLGEALVAAAGDAEGSDARLWEGAGGGALLSLLGTLADDPAATSLLIRGREYPYFLAAMMGEASVVEPRSNEPRIHIWGALEARLQSVDRLILAGLDEGVWPSATRTDPWLSRAMRTDMGLPPPERRIGLAAHDFSQGMASAEVIVTRAEKRGGAPTVESRWMQRLRALAGSEAMAGMEARGAGYVALARELDRPAGKPQGIPRPEPRPPVALRPRRLSVTEIETLIRDPYAVYAKHVLRLRRLDDLGLKPDAALRGTLIHDALGRFTVRWSGALGDDAEAQLLAIGQEVLQAVEAFPEVHTVWLRRFGAVARWFAGWERQREERVLRRHAEIAGAWTIPAPAGPFTLRARADRVDLMRDGTIAIYDFKTGTPQTDRTVFAGLTPQMTLEAAMVRAGAFEDVKEGAGASVSDLAWLAIGNIARGKPYQSAVRKGETADDLADRAGAMLATLIAAYDDPSKPYLARARPMMERWPGDYDHLARVREWALLEGDDDLAGGGA